MSIELNPGMFGWNSDAAPAAFAAYSHLFSPLAIRAEPPKDMPPIWQWSKALNGGKHLPTWNQLRGDCVSMGAHCAIEYCEAARIGAQHLAEKFKLIFPPWIYGTSRHQIGQDELGHSTIRDDSNDGSTGAWAVAAMAKYGLLSVDDPGVPAYDAQVVVDWGNAGPPKQFFDVAKPRLLKKFTKLTTVDEIRAALKSYRPVTFAIDWYYDPNTVQTVKGYRCVKRGRKLGGHQVCLIHWNDEINAALHQNSWSEDAFKGPAPLDEPPGSAYILTADLEKDLRGRNVEAYAIDVFDSDPAESWYGLFGSGS